LKKGIWFSAFILSFLLVVGCSTAPDMYTASYFSDKIQGELDKAQAQRKNQMEVEKILAADPNMSDKKKIDQALADFNRLDTQIIPTYEKAMKQVQISVHSLSQQLTKVKSQDVKQLSQNTIQSFQKMLAAELAYIENAKRSSELQKGYFTTLQKGQIPTDAVFDQMNQDITTSGNVFTKLNASIDEFNKHWEKLVQKAGQELQQ
jgi:hypothetical protein